jgi:hypothetical protein
MDPIKNPALNNAGLRTGVGAACTVSQLINVLITAAFVIGFIVFVFYFIWGAIKWILSQGDKGKVQDAKSQLTQALTGLVLLLSFYIIVSVVGHVFNIDLLRLPLGFGFSSGTSCGPVPGPGPGPAPPSTPI